MLDTYEKLRGLHCELQWMKAKHELEVLFTLQSSWYNSPTEEFEEGQRANYDSLGDRIERFIEETEKAEDYKLPFYGRVRRPVQSDGETND